MAWTAGAAGRGGTRRALSSHTLLFDLPPALLGEFCAVLDSCDGALGWRGLGERGGGGGAAGRRRALRQTGCGAAGRPWVLRDREASQALLRTCPFLIRPGRDADTPETHPRAPPSSQKLGVRLNERSPWGKPATRVKPSNVSPRFLSCLVGNILKRHACEMSLVIVKGPPECNFRMKMCLYL